MRLFYSRQALRDLQEIQAFYRSKSRQAADNVARAILNAIELIHARPDIGIRSAPNPRVRSKLLTKYPYRIYYRLFDANLEILHIRHAARRPWSGVTE